MATDCTTTDFLTCGGGNYNAMQYDIYFIVCVVHETPKAENEEENVGAKPDMLSNVGR
jgi:hypothetical protein